ncbi:MAG TPA: hypothetical protein VK505_10870 [Steroidobacteraceae bacterium]|nr:hypothetical protein [Steroidobacteraceae bacterium]
MASIRGSDAALRSTRTLGGMGVIDSASIFPSLGASARLYWRSFIYAWLAPVFVLIVWPLLGVLGALSTKLSAVISFLIVIVPTMMFANYKARRPLQDGKIPRVHFVIWANLVPFVVWVTLLSIIFVPLLILGD